MFGGISSLKAHGLAWLLSIADIMNAVNTLQKPMYPMLDVAGNVLNFDPPLTLFPVKRWSEEEYAYPPGSAFLELLFFSPPVNDELVTYFVHLGQLSTVIEYYSRHPELCTSTLLDILGDSRNLVHHRLFSLPDDSDDISLYILPSSPEPDPSHLEFTREMYHICRLSALLYSIHVTFPTPRIAPQQRQLATALHSKLQALADREGGTSNPLLLWPILILTISYGIGSPHAMEWLPLLKKLCLELRLDSRGSLLKYLRSFAWVDSAYPETNGDVLSQIICS
ncbi:hypothetical protein BJY04DRAFT_192570 [Aspergillus karnatakaensis]|uniref:uncharacterized protein n=1 Tax=Aspergillus karnatakaensis TaxID=1810916 RepID=UPI003CCDF095